LKFERIYFTAFHELWKTAKLSTINEGFWYGQHLKKLNFPLLFCVPNRSSCVLFSNSFSVSAFR